MSKKRLIIVLGMHRSGTSAVARGLQVLNVDLGDQFIPPLENNPKGFWEDKDFYALNNEMLLSVGQDWHYLVSLDHNDIELLNKKGYLLRALDLLRQKTLGVGIFGIKDPRFPKLLVFWKEVFLRSGFDVSYVLALRNPLSVVRSLKKRDDFDEEKSYLLWLSHVIDSLVETSEESRVLVDYDILMQNPEQELLRISEKLELNIDEEEMQVYKSDFLDHDLRHTYYNPDDLLLDDSCPPLVSKVYKRLYEVALGKTPLDERKLLDDINYWKDEFLKYSYFLFMADKMHVSKASAVSALNERLSETTAQLAERDAQLAERDAQLAERDAQLAERDAKIEELISTVDSICNSRSWRVTAPFRNVGLFIRNIFNRGYKNGQ